MCKSTRLLVLGLRDVLEDDRASPLVLILDQLLRVLPLRVRRVLEEGGESMVGDIEPVEVGEHSHVDVDVAGVELLVDLLVDQTLGFLLEVLTERKG